MGCLRTRGPLHPELILKHRKSGNPVYKLWTKIWSPSSQAWLEFISLVESAYRENQTNAAAPRCMCCWKCDSPNHLANDGPHAAVIKDLVVRNRRNKGQAVNAVHLSTPTSGASAGSKETAGVVSLLLTGTTCTANKWLYGSGY